MSDFAVRIVEITQPVENHPDADRLSIVKIGGYLCISGKVELDPMDENTAYTHRYNVGDKVAYVPEGALVPEYILRDGFWSEKDNKGLLAGSKGNRVKAKRLRGIFSQGLLLPAPDGTLTNEAGETHSFVTGDDVAGFLGITKYEPPIPVALAGEVVCIFGYAIKYDFESIQSVVDLFHHGEAVEVTEKLHGTNCQIGYVPGLNHDELFGSEGNIYVGSKGLSAKGLVMKNNETNAGNLYVRTLTAMLSEGLEDRLRAEFGNTPVRLFGEVYGKGVQDLSYGLNAPAFALFDIKVGDTFLMPNERNEVAERLQIPVVPVLYHGAYDLDTLIGFRDGKDTISGTNVREGIVIRSMDNLYHPHHGRKIGKWVSPDYLERRGGTEFN